MALSKNIVTSVAPTVNAAGELANSFFKFAEQRADSRRLDEQMAAREAEKAEADRKWNITNARAEEAAKQRRDALTAEAKQKEALRTYDPRFGELGGRGIQARALEDYSTKAGADIESILGRYNVGTGTGQVSIGQMEAPQRDLLAKELGGLGSAIGSELKALAPSKAEAEELIRSDLIQAEVDSGVAYDEAAKRTKNLLSRKDIETAEQKLTDERNKALKVKKDNLNSILKYDTASNKSTVASKKVSSPDELYAYIGESGVGPLDKTKATKAVEAALKVKGVTPTRVMQALQQLKEPEKYGLEGLLTGREFKSTDTPAEFLKYIAENTTETGSSGRRELNAVERAILNAPHLAASSYGDIMAKAGREAYKDKGFGGETVVTPAATTPPAPQNPPPGGTGGGQGGGQGSGLGTPSPQETPTPAVTTVAARNEVPANIDRLRTLESRYNLPAKEANELDDLRARFSEGKYKGLDPRNSLYDKNRQQSAVAKLVELGIDPNEYSVKPGISNLFGLDDKYEKFAKLERTNPGLAGTIKAALTDTVADTRAKARILTTNADTGRKDLEDASAAVQKNKPAVRDVLAPTLTTDKLAVSTPIRKDTRGQAANDRITVDSLYSRNIAPIGMRDIPSLGENMNIGKEKLPFGTDATTNSVAKAFEAIRTGKELGADFVGATISDFASGSSARKEWEAQASLASKEVARLVDSKAPANSIRAIIAEEYKIFLPKTIDFMDMDINEINKILKEKGKIHL